MKAQSRLDSRQLEAASLCLRTLAHPTRLRMVQLLLERERTVGTLADACGIPSAVASDHLGKMKDRGLLVSERRGRYTVYTAVHEALDGILACIEGHFGGRRRR